MNTNLGNLVVRFLVIFALITLGGCAASNRFNVIKNGEVPGDKRIIMVSPGSAGMLGVTKQVLSEKKWKMVALQGPKRTVGTIGEGKVDISEYGEATAAYILVVKEQFIGYECMPTFSDYAGEPETSNFRYSVSIVDWHDGSEVMTIGGSGCLSDIKNNLREHIP